MPGEHATQPQAKAEGDASEKEKLAPKPKTAKAVRTKLKIVRGRRRGWKPYPVIPFEQALRIGHGKPPRL